MELFAGIIGVFLYIFFVGGSPQNTTSDITYLEIIVNSRFGHNETKTIHTKNFTWVDEANVKLDQKGIIRDETGRPYFINNDGFIEIDTQKINEENQEN